MTSDPDAQYRRDILTFIRAMTGPVDHSNPPPGVLPPSLDVEGMTPDERLLARWDAAELMRGTDPYAAGAADAVDHVARCWPQSIQTSLATSRAGDLMGRQIGLSARPRRPADQHAVHMRYIRNR